MTKRTIVEIDEQKCDGCGLCVPSCAEGAIQIIDGKARLVSDVYCDGLGACLGHCPRDAIRLIEREAAAYDDEAAQRHVSGLPAKTQTARRPAPALHAGCPGAAVRTLAVVPRGAPRRSLAHDDDAEGGLVNWPIQLHLVPPGAAFLQDADLVLAADCVAFAMPDFHRRLLRGRPVLVGCPKLDDARAYVERLAAILSQSRIRSLTVAHMEVPCCMGLMRIAEAAQARAGSNLPLEEVVVGVDGRR